MTRFLGILHNGISGPGDVLTVMRRGALDERCAQAYDAWENWAKTGRGIPGPFGQAEISAVSVTPTDSVQKMIRNAVNNIRFGTRWVMDESELEG